MKLLYNTIVWLKIFDRIGCLAFTWFSVGKSVNFKLTQ
jgi:hypothetical protein